MNLAPYIYIAELERRNRNLRAQLRETRKSRDLWKHRAIEREHILRQRRRFLGIGRA